MSVSFARRTALGGNACRKANDRTTQNCNVASIKRTYPRESGDTVTPATSDAANPFDLPFVSPPPPSYRDSAPVHEPHGSRSMQMLVLCIAIAALYVVLGVVALAIR